MIGQDSLKTGCSATIQYHNRVHMLYTKKHREMVEWSNFQNELAVFGCVGSQGSQGAKVKCHNFQQLLSVLFSYFYWQHKGKIVLQSFRKTTLTKSGGYQV